MSSSISRRVLLAFATSERFEIAVRGLPGGERAAFRRALRYVAGRERGDAFALALAHRLANKGVACSIDLFGENVSDPAEADRVAEMYVELAGALAQAPPGTSLSLDLSHIGIDQPGDAPPLPFSVVGLGGSGRAVCPLSS
jgi:proline dehydrogenase